MDKTDKILIEFIKGGIHKDYDCKEAGSQIDEKFDWSLFLQQAYNQVVMGIAWDGLVKSGFTALPREVKFKWYSDVISSYESRYKQHESHISHLAEFYNLHNIDMLILKGYGLSLNYPNPLHRPCGDIDMYLFGKQEFADDLIEKEKGIHVVKSNALHSVFCFEGESVENHSGFVIEEVHRYNKQIENTLLEEIQKGKERIDIESENSKSFIFIPSPQFNALYLLHHTAKHFASEQVMLRHILDWGTFVRKYRENIDWDSLYDIAEKTHINIFLNALNMLCIKYLGFEDKEFPIRWSNNVKRYSSERLEKLADKIFEEILHPKFSNVKPSGFLKNKLFRINRWLSYSWKRKTVYGESMMESLIRRITC